MVAKLGRKVEKAKMRVLFARRDRTHSVERSMDQWNMEVTKLLRNIGCEA